MALVSRTDHNHCFALSLEMLLSMLNDGIGKGMHAIIVGTDDHLLLRRAMISTTF
jgi:hypothetical protein